jgi:hypothetical protein
VAFQYRSRCRPISLGLLSNCLTDHVGWGVHVFPSCPPSPQSPAKLTWYPVPSAAERMVNWRDSNTILHQLGASCRRSEPFAVETETDFGQFRGIREGGPLRDWGIHVTVPFLLECGYVHT